MKLCWHTWIDIESPVFVASLDGSFIIIRYQDQILDRITMFPWTSCNSYIDQVCSKCGKYYWGLQKAIKKTKATKVLTEAKAHREEQLKVRGLKDREMWKKANG